MDARPGGPAAKREPSPEGLGINPENDLSAVGAAPDRTRISCRASPDTAARVAFVTESSMKLANTTNLNRKSGGA
jgi:hypothetical protein